MTDPARVHVGVVFGGQSAEHEVSLQSARNVIAALDPERYQVTLIGIDRQGRWHLADRDGYLLNASDPRRIELGATRGELALVPGGRVGRGDLLRISGESEVADPSGGRSSGGPRLPSLDVVFPVLHGPLGEDGTIQGLLRLAHLPFVGPGVLGSAVGMDKDVAKRLLRDAGIPIARFRTVGARVAEETDYADIVEDLGLPVFVKPANMGSSVGVERVVDPSRLPGAVRSALAYDTKVLVEEAVHGREIEVAVLGNEEPEASIPGEIVPHHEFYSYEAKYIDDAGADLRIPAELDADTSRRVRELAVRTFRTLCCEGMARVDFFLRPDGQLVVNELNTIPGFTRISMYPKLWEASGLSYGALIDRLIQLAIERSRRDEALRAAVADESATLPEAGS